MVTPIQNDAKGTYGFVGYNTVLNEIVISFRGSVNMPNFMTDLDFFKEPYLGVP